LRRRVSLVLVLALAVGLGLTACGGGDDGDEEAILTEATDTGTLLPADTGLTEEETPPAEPAEPPAAGDVVQIKLPKAGETIGPQSPAARVEEVQRALVALGFRIGEPDGIYGARTRRAVTRFQRNHDLEADGLVGRQTARAMNRELRQQAAGET
jgi:peptidoglycan hydrolase-like protein with peptidoglycan-binding domain